MRPIKRILLTLLTMFPVASISTVAYSQLSEMAGENQTALLSFKLSQTRRLIFPTGVFAITREKAKERLAQETGIANEQALEEELNRNLKFLYDNGLIEINEWAYISSAPSVW